MDEGNREIFYGLGRRGGRIEAFAFNRAMAEAMEYLSIQDAIENGVNKQIGKTPEEFCKMHGASYSTYKRRKSELSLLGKDLWIVAKVLGFGFIQIQELAVLPESDKAKIKLQGEVVVIGDQKIPWSKPAEIQEALQAINNTIEITFKEKAVLEKELRHHQKKEVELEQKINDLSKEVSALKPPEIAENRKTQFLEQIDLVYDHLAACSGLLHHKMDFSLALNDRDLAVKYRAVCKMVIAIAHNLEDKIGEVD